MPPRVWNDINLPGFSRSKEEEKESARVTLDTIKQSADAAVNSAKSQVDDIKQNAAQIVNDVKPKLVILNRMPLKLSMMPNRRLMISSRTV